jgi:hypothetical protein
MLTKFAIAVLLFCTVAGLEVSEQALAKDIVSTCQIHSKTNGQFAELEAATTIAMRGETSKSGVSPIAQVAAMTDMMLIQTQHEIDELIESHTQYQDTCKTRSQKQAGTIEEKQVKEKLESVDIWNFENKWRHLTEDTEIGLPSFPVAIATKDRDISTANDQMAAAIAKRKAKHTAFLKAMEEHAAALADVRKIRLIIQNSNLDNKARVGATVSAGKKSVSSPTVTKGLLQLEHSKATVHPKLLHLVELAHTSLSTASGIDKIYALLYQTRDELLESQNKLKKGEASAISNWRTNKIAFRNDINDLIILKHTYYQQWGTTKKQIGLYKKAQGEHMQTRAEEVRIKEDTTIERNFLMAACLDEQQRFSEDLSVKKSEKKSLEAVQKKLVSLKWSTKVYAAVATVSEGVIYLKGDYNIRSRLGRYMIADKNVPYFQPVGKKNVADKFFFQNNPDDLSYHIMRREGTGKTIKKWYLTENNNKVTFERTPSKASRWDVDYDKESNSLYIRNKATRNTLFVDAKNKYTLSTLQQTTDKRSQFFVEHTDYERVGCYKNKINKNMEYYAGASNKMTTSICYEKCVSSGKTFTHFGLTEEQMCYCGTTWYKDRAPASDCGFLCGGRDGDLCGGKQRTLVYEKTGDPKPVLIAAKPVLTK